MLTMTENASTVVKTISHQAEDVEGSGLRISTSSDVDSQLSLAVVPAPADNDLVIEQDGARVFVEPAASALLDDKVLDAQVGEDGAINFAVAVQP